MKKKHPAIGAPPFMETSIFPPENRHEMYHPSHCRRGYIEETIVWCSSLQPVTADADFTRNGEKMIEKYRKYEISGEKSGIQKSEHPQKHQKLDAELFFWQPAWSTRDTSTLKSLKLLKWSRKWFKCYFNRSSLLDHWPAQLKAAGLIPGSQEYWSIWIIPFRIKHNRCWNHEPNIRILQIAKKHTHIYIYIYI